MTFKLDKSHFTEIDTYEDCPCDVELLVFTGDSFEVEYVTMDAETGAFYPANGIQFSHYLECPEVKELED